MKKRSRQTPQRSLFGPTVHPWGQWPEATRREVEEVLAQLLAQCYSVGRAQPESQHHERQD